VVLLDIEMPGLTGADALIAIQAVPPAVKSHHGPVALGRRPRSANAGARGVRLCHQPVDLEHLAQSVENGGDDGKRLES